MDTSSIDFLSEETTTSSDDDNNQRGQGDGIVVLSFLDRKLDDDRYHEVTYEDIGGCHKLLSEIKELVEVPLRYPELYQTLGVPPPHGLLLHGPPGCGKSLLMKAIACEVFFWGVNVHVYMCMCMYDRSIFDSESVLVEMSMRRFDFAYVYYYLSDTINTTI
jgi:hypothetical protein